MKKKYVAKSCVAVTIAIEGGGKCHVTFEPRTGSGSMYYTENEKIQAGLESHPKFGKLFQLVGVAEEPKPEEPTQEETETAVQGGELTMQFCCNDDAKDYLADKYGVSRSQMRTRAAIEGVAKDKGIVIVWTDK